MDFQWVFSDFGKKISQVCWNSNLSVQRKKYQKNLLNNLFFVFFGFWQENPVILQESFWQGCQKNFRLVQWNTYRATFPDGSLENSRFFGSILKFSGQWWKTFFSVGKTAIDIHGNSLWKLFSKEKNSLFFSDCERMFTSSENFCQSCETRNLCIRGSFWGKTVFEIYTIFQTFFGLWSKKRLVGKIFFSQVVTTAIRTSSGIFWEKINFFLKTVLFVHLFWSLSNFFCLLTKKVRVSKKQPTNTEKSWRKKNCGKIVFSNHFRISSRKVWTIRQKKLAGL